MLQGTTESRAFTSPRAKRDSKRPPSFPPRDDPAGHARSLLADIQAVKDTAQDLADARRQAQLDDCAGVFIDVRFVPNEDFPLESLTAETSLVETVAVTQLQDGTAQATVFVPDGKLSILENKIRAFAPLDASKVPRHRPMVSSLESIRRSVALSFWTDPVKPFPTSEGRHKWEVWLRRGQDVGRFKRHARILGMVVSPRELKFPDRTVLLVDATVAEITRSAELLDSLAELRSPPPVDLELLPFDARDELELAHDLAARIERAHEGAPSVCVLDTGVDYEHPLLRAALLPADAHTCFGDDLRDRFGAGGDWHGTGTAGLALFGQDLGEALIASGAWQHRHHLESVKFLPSRGENEEELYGEVTKEAVARAELGAPNRSRVVVTTVTAKRIAAGEPSSWSAAFDQLCSGAEEDEQTRRLILVAAGNVVPSNSFAYPDTNHVETIEDPAQAWNVITVGAFTARTQIEETDYANYVPIAPEGDLSPTSRTTVAWGPNKMSPPPFKPDLVCEGGNWASQTDDFYPTPLNSLSPLSTRRRDFSSSRVLSRFNGTSGAAAIAAHLAAELQAEYPELWPETIRALLVHSCRYTPAMLEGFAGLSPRKRARAMLRAYGHGVPDLGRVRYSARNELTLVSEREIQPFRVDQTKKTGRTHEMHMHRLPWPTDVLEQLGALNVRLRVTLSYFVEPNPGKREVRGDLRTKIVNAARYPSHGLRFEVAKPGEAPEALLERVNAAERTGNVDETSDTKHWRLGYRERARGSLHSDVWQGHAADLSDKFAIAVVPVNGWWRFRPKTPELCNRRTRYALVVSIETDAEQVDLYTPVVALVAAQR